MRALIALPLLLSLAACERQEDAASDKVEATAGSEAQNPATAPAAAQFEPARLDRLPADGFELPVAYHRLHENPMEATDGREYRALVETFDDRASIVAALDDAFTRQGFSAGATSTSDGAQILTYSDPAGDVVTIRLSPMPDGTAPTAPDATGLLHLTWRKPA